MDIDGQISGTIVLLLVRGHVISASDETCQRKKALIMQCACCLLSAVHVQ